MNVLMETLTPEQQTRLLQRSEFSQAVDNYERKLKPYTKVWKVLSVVATGVVALFGAGMVYQQFLGGNATKADIEKHAKEELEPVKVQVEKHTEMIEGVSYGVDKLVRKAEAERGVARAQQVVDMYSQEYEEALSEWMSNGKHGPKPTKREEWVQAEIALKDAKEALIKVW